MLHIGYVTSRRQRVGYSNQYLVLVGSLKLGRFTAILLHDATQASNSQRHAHDIGTR
jgi:hypothetical protein